MQRYPVAVLAVLLVVAGVGAVPVAGHGNHLTADAQVVEDHVVVERSFMLTDGYAVVHLDQGGSMGRVLGHTEVSSGASSNFAIDVDQEFLSQIDGTAKVWVVLHRDDGDGEFEPNQDTPITGVQGREAGATIPIYASDAGNVNVVARDFGDQRVDEPAVTVRRVETNASRFVAVEGPDGSVVGTTSVEAGTHENVSVDLEESFYESLAVNESVGVTAVVYDDDDGEFDADVDEPVTVRDQRVASEFSIQKVRNASATTSLVVTAAETTTSSSTGGDDATDETATTADGEAASTGPSPGFEVAMAVFAILVVAVLVRRRRT